jgi:histone-lysine N-methyltransferase SETD2
LDKAVRKKEEREKSKAARGDAQGDGNTNTPDTPHGDVKLEGTDSAEEILAVRDEATAADEASPNDSLSELKRKRDDEDESSPRNTRTRTDESAPAPPPPPPPPPAEDMPMEVDESVSTPMDDGSFGSCTEGAEGSEKGVSQINGLTSPMQLATPSVNGTDGGKANGSSHVE